MSEGEGGTERSGADAGEGSSPGTPDLGGLFEQAAKMQEQLLAAQEQAEATVVEGRAGGGAVVVEVSGAWEFQQVTIDPAAVDPDDTELLADLVLAALRDAAAKVQELQQGSIGEIDLGGLGGLLGPA
ncbi:MAG TPA: YbaB/EbfC family nucleoid-associated protein [Acidimicrobiales bacterium]|nr:YbaB/EbfC family nucleoid-associated protein [Acidimicrobiales bacterium]